MDHQKRRNFIDRLVSHLEGMGIEGEAAIISFLSKAANADENTVRRWIDKDVKQRPSAKQFESIATALGMDVDYLRGGHRPADMPLAGSDKAAVASRINVLISQHPRYEESRANLARDLELSNQSIQRWVDGTAQPRGKNLIGLARFLHTTPAYIQHGICNAEQMEQPRDLYIAAGIPTKFRDTFTAQFDAKHIEKSVLFLVGVPAEKNKIHLVEVPRLTLTELTQARTTFCVTIKRNGDEYTIGDRRIMRLRRGVVRDGTASLT